MREAKTALKSGSSPLALSSFPKLFDRLCAAHKGTYFVKKNYGKMCQHFSRVKDCVLVAVQRRDAGRA